MGRALREEFHGEDNWDSPPYVALAQMRTCSWSPNTPQLVLVRSDIDLLSILAVQPVSCVGYLAMLHAQFVPHSDWGSLEHRVRVDISRIHGTATAQRVLEFWHRVRHGNDDLSSLGDILGLKYGMLPNLRMPAPYFIRH